MSLLIKASFAAALAISTPVAAQPLVASEFPARILAAHNAERALVGAPPLVWDNDLGTAAATYAAQMATTGFDERSSVDRGPMRR